jgi:hypothetical protein
MKTEEVGAAADSLHLAKRISKGLFHSNMVRVSHALIEIG